MTSGPYEFRAFLAYSRRDDDLPRRVWGIFSLGKIRWARSLHRTLEHFAIDNALAERIAALTPKNLNPASTRPIFLDRADFVPSGTLDQRTINALEKSQFLVVLCSPNAVASPYVNEEVRQFKHMHRTKKVLPIIPVILSGEPGDAARECFPAALRFKLAEDGTLTTEPDKPPLAADLRPQGDGAELAPQKVIAALLDVPLDEIVKRAQASRRRELRIRTAVAGVMVILAVAAGLFWVQAEINKALATDRAEVAERRLNIAIDLVNDRVQEALRRSDRIGTRVSDTLRELEWAERDLNNLAESEGDPPHLRYRKAQVLMSLADSYAKLGKTADREKRGHEANSILKDLVENDKSKFTDYLRDVAISEGKLADTWRDQGRSEDALNAYSRALQKLAEIGQVPASVIVEIDKLIAGILAKRAIVHESRGHQSSAREDTDRSHSIFNRLAQSHGDDRNIQREFALSYWGLSDRRYFEKKYEEAASLLLDGLTRLISLSESDQDNLKLQIDIGRFHNRLGEVLLRQGNDKTAQALHHLGLADQIFEAILARDPLDAAMKREVSVSATRLGDAALGRKDFVAAKESYEKGLKTAEELSRADETDASKLRNEGAMHGRLGRLFLAKDNPSYNPSTALARFQKQVEISSQLLKRERESLYFKLDMAIAYSNISDAHSALGDQAAAIAAARESVRLHQEVAAVSPSAEELQDMFQNAREKLQRLLAPQE